MRLDRSAMPVARSNHGRNRRRHLPRILFWFAALFAAATLETATLHAQTSQTSCSGLSGIDPVLDAGIAAKKLPGAVVVIGHGGKVLFHRAYGMRSLTPAREPMTEDTVFDVASLTKVLITAPAVLQLYEIGLLHLDDPVARYLPAFGSNGKSRITIRQLLTHTSGLAADLPLEDPWSGKQEALRRAYASAPVSAPGSEFRYSDINYIVLAALVEKLSSLSLDAYAERYILQPLGLRETRFLPPPDWRARIAPTQREAAGTEERSLVNDPTARRMGGVAGNAGLFSTASDISAYAQSLLDRLQGRPSHFPLLPSTLKLMTTPIRIESRGRTTLHGLGWDIDSVYSSPRGRLFPVGSFGHTGYTGTSLWIDPASDTYVVLLANAVYPNGHTDLREVRSDVATCAAAAVAALSPAKRVLAGIDVLEKDHFAELAELAARHGGRLRLGLLTNPTGVDALGRRTPEVLAREAAAQVPGLELKMLFSPEHGINGELDREGIASSTDPATGLPVISLYGATDAQRRPSLETLRQLDGVVIDLQDAGVRFYTYETLVRYFLEAASQTGTEIILLDRPNPLNGVLVQGPLSDPGRESYVNAMPIPERHGMTLGELARYFNGEGKLGAPLTVIPMSGWQREDWFDQTGLPWVNPSPNLRSVAAATLYPALGLIESTNISVGRGTGTPFAYVGAPWIETGGADLARYLNARSLPGVRFERVSFTPQPPYPFANQLCAGVRVLVTERDAVDMPELGLEIASALRHLYGSRYDLVKMDRLLVNRGVLNALVAGEDPRRIAAEWSRSLAAFEQARRPYLLYSEQPPQEDRRKLPKTLRRR